MRYHRAPGTCLHLSNETCVQKSSDSNNNIDRVFYSCLFQATLVKFRYNTKFALLNSTWHCMWLYWWAPQTFAYFYSWVNVEWIYYVQNSFQCKMVILTLCTSLYNSTLLKYLNPLLEFKPWFPSSFPIPLLLSFYLLKKFSSFVK